MSEDIKLEVVTPEKSVISEIVKIVMAPGLLGEFGVLPGHTPFLTTLKTGAVRFTDESGREKFVFVSSGFAEALPNKVTILVDSAERKEEIDVQRAKKALKRAEERLSVERENVSKIGDDVFIDFQRAHSALYRAINRIKLVEGDF